MAPARFVADGLVVLLDQPPLEEPPILLAAAAALAVVNLGAADQVPLVAVAHRAVALAEAAARLVNRNLGHRLTLAA